MCFLHASSLPSPLLGSGERAVKKINPKRALHPSGRGTVSKQVSNKVISSEENEPVTEMTWIELSGYHLVSRGVKYHFLQEALPDCPDETRISVVF